MVYIAETPLSSKRMNIHRRILSTLPKGTRLKTCVDIFTKNFIIPKNSNVYLVCHNEVTEVLVTYNGEEHVLYDGWLTHEAIEAFKQLT
jgi:hypothetical protein